MERKTIKKRSFGSGKKSSTSRSASTKKNLSISRSRRIKNKHAIKKTAKKANYKMTAATHQHVVDKPKTSLGNQAKNPNAQADRKNRRINQYIPSQKETDEALRVLLSNDFAVDYIRKNVNKNALDVLSLLRSPNTDEAIAAQLDMKVNSVRRILNIMQGYRITNYYVAKNTNGWLSFAWYININKIGSFFDYIKSMKGDEYSIIKDNCNDYFVCKKCYNDDNIIFTFDAAYETGFKCASCGNKFEMINKEEATALINQDKQRQDAALQDLRLATSDQRINRALPSQQ